MIPLWFIPLFPLLGTLVLGVISLTSSTSEKGAPEGITGTLAVLFPFLSFISVIALSWNMPLEGIRETLGVWIDTGSFQIAFGFLFDGLSRIMLLFITGIGLLITIYSTGYMHGDRGFARFFSYINLFLFSMIILVLSDSLPFTFLGWEGVGLCSYLLIGFWNTDAKNCAAANKAFIVNRVGDIGFLLGMLVLVTIGGSSLLAYPELLQLFNQAEASSFIQENIGLFSLAGFLFFFGCTGKSAQIPLLTWLPDAMAGPTPVSALIHAATMVTSGVYLLARLSGMFALLPDVLFVITLVGLATAFWAAVAGLFQNDIKKLLAYSTISQLGFMFMAAGVAAFDVSIFHVFTHAFFKAALFLGAGAVIHSLSGEQDMRRMGGLLKKLPLTSLVLIFGWLAIIGFPGFAGFWSKDLILERLFESAPISGPIFYSIALLTAVITAVYMTRFVILTLLGKYRGAPETEKHIHESPSSMMLPMLVLTVGSAFAGFLWAGLIPGADFFKELLSPVLGTAQTAAYEGVTKGPHLSPWLFAGLGTLAAFVGIFIAWKLFARPVPQTKEDTVPRGLGGEWTFFFDKLHHVCVLLPVRVFAWVCDKVIHSFIMLVQWLVSGIVEILGDGVRFFQVRKIRVQIGLSFFGMVLMVAFAVFYGGM